MTLRDYCNQEFISGRDVSLLSFLPLFPALFSCFPSTFSLHFPLLWTPKTPIVTTLIVNRWDITKLCVTLSSRKWHNSKFTCQNSTLEKQMWRSMAEPCSALQWPLPMCCTTDEDHVCETTFGLTGTLSASSWERLIVHWLRYIDICNLVIIKYYNCLAFMLGLCRRNNGQISVRMEATSRCSEM